MSIFSKMSLSCNECEKVILEVHVPFANDLQLSKDITDFVHQHNNEKLTTHKTKHGLLCSFNNLEAVSNAQHYYVPDMILIKNNDYRLNPYIARCKLCERLIFIGHVHPKIKWDENKTTASLSFACYCTETPKLSFAFNVQRNNIMFVSKHI